MTPSASTVPPLRRQVLVACDPATAQRLWTDDIGAWWPLEKLSVFGAGATVEFVGDDIIETSTTGETAVWGTVTNRRADTLAFTWHPGFGPERAGQVTVTFAAARENLTLVTLEHTGWEKYDDPAAARGEYAGGWVTVLDLLAASRPGSASDVWLVLCHTSGPTAPAAGVFASPDFPRHIEFLSSLREAGVLVAGGSLPDDPGTGMTIVRTPDLDTARQTVARAQIEDGAVTSGLLDVRVRPWRVAVTGGRSA